MPSLALALMPVSHSFPKSEHLKRKKLIDGLFQSGNKAFHYPVMAVWKECELLEEVPVQAGFSVSKKFLKKAVDRNLVKRRMREAYRLEKSELQNELTAAGKQVAIMFITVKTDNTSYEQLHRKMVLTLRSIARKVAHDK